VNELGRITVLVVQGAETQLVVRMRRGVGERVCRVVEDEEA